MTAFTLITAPKALIAVLAANLQAHVSCNDALPPAPFEDMTVFHALEAPAISVADYVARVAKFAFCSDACLVAAFHYVNRAVAVDPKLALTSLSVHRLFITAVVLACKYFDDISYNLTYYSKVGGLPPKELANLEFSLLSILDFRLDITTDDFVAIEKSMVEQLSFIEAKPMDDILSNLVANAQRELVLANFAPVVVVQPQVVEDSSATTAPNTCPMRTSPVSSGYTSDASLSRNSSMSSVSDAPEQQVSRKTNSKEMQPSHAKSLSHSPTTPVSTERAAPIAMVC